jgi:signal transduction histidine kinase
MRKKVIALIFIIAVISFLIITLPAFLEQNSNSQQELVDSETGTSVSLSTTDITEDKITSIYENVNYIDNETFNKIKEAYNRIDFDVSFNAGNLDTYDFYKKQFNRL